MALTVSQRQRLIAVSRGDRPADLYVRGGALLNVHTGEVYPANVAIAGERIAYVGLRDDMVGPRTRVLDARDHILCPGYVEPHSHPANLVTPASLARHLLPLGTTSLFGDQLQFWELGGYRAFRLAADALVKSPLKFYWMLRVHAQSQSRDEDRRFALRDLVRAIEHPWVAAVGEMTRWYEAYRGDAELLARLALAPARRKRIEGHTAGAGPERIGAIAAAGVTSDHEPITAAEVLDRARQGIAVMLRQSSLRPDLRVVIDALKAAPGLVSRVMLTTDGAMPAFIAQHGFTDHLLTIAMEQGIAPVDAYRMVTLNPATYYGLDGEIGSIAPGRYADVLLLRDLGEPRPDTVIARGRLAAQDGRLLARITEPRWSRIFASDTARLRVRWRASADDFRLPRRPTYPVLRLVSTVISRLEERPLAPGDLHAAVIDRRGRWVAPAVVAGFAAELDGLASTITTDFEILVLGRRPESMARAVNRVLDLHGGIVIVDGETPAFELPLPVGGVMVTSSLEEAARLELGLHTALAERGYPHHDPLFTLFFMVADFLPAVRLSTRGVWDVKRRRILLPARPRPRRASRSRRRGERSNERGGGTIARRA
jgi:adenine deaminase